MFFIWGRRIRRTTSRAAADDGRKYKQALRVIDGRCYGLVVRDPIAPITALRIARLNARGIMSLQLIDLIAGIAVVDSAALAKGIAINDAPHIGVVIITSRIFRSAAPAVT